MIPDQPPTSTGPASRRRRRVVVASALVVIAIATAAAGVHLANRRSILGTAAGLLSCPTEQLQLVSSQSSDTSEVYHLRGCGKDSTLVCEAPEYTCLVAPAPSDK